MGLGLVFLPSLQAALHLKAWAYGCKTLQKSWFSFESILLRYN